MSQQPLTEAIEHYLREIYKLGAGGEPVSVSALARAQEVSAASASAMVKKLAALELLEHEPYRGFHLTPAGEKVAIEVIRHHRHASGTADACTSSGRSGHARRRCGSPRRSDRISA